VARQPLTDSARNRARFADKWRPGYRAAIARALADYAREVASAAASGMGFPDHLTAKLRVRLREIERRWMTQMVASGFDYAGAELPATRPAGKPKTDDGVRGKADEPDVAIGGTSAEDLAASASDKRSNDFLLRGNFTAIDEWVRTTSARDADGTRKRLEQVWHDAENSRDPETGVAWTPRQISQAILDRGIAATEARADMLARTGTIWAMNEGAEQRYAAAGIQVEEWSATEDDATCPFCMQFDGKIVKVHDPFWTGGESVGVTNAAGQTLSLKIPEGMNIQHPPLHPNCRCTLMPVITEVNVPEAPLELQEVATDQVVQPAEAIEVPVEDPRAAVRDMSEAQFEKHVDNLAKKMERRGARYEREIDDAAAKADLLNQEWMQLGVQEERLSAEMRLAGTDAEFKKLGDAYTALLAKKEMAKEAADVAGIALAKLRLKNRNVALDVLKEKKPPKMDIGYKKMTQADFPYLDTREVMERAAKDFQRVVSTNVTAGSQWKIPVKASVKPTNGLRWSAFADPDDNSISLIPSQSSYATMIHELGHTVEFQSKRARESARAFLERRTAGEQPVRLKDLVPGSSYDDSEKTRPDKFIDPYVGKVYWHFGRSDHHTEVISVGLQHMMTDPVAFYRADRDHFRLIVGILKGRVMS
jgi:hypothetical protein